MRKPEIPQTDRIQQGFQQFIAGVYGIVAPVDGEVVFHNRWKANHLYKGFQKAKETELRHGKVVKGNLASSLSVSA